MLMIEKFFMKSAGTRGYSPLARVFTLAVMLLTMATTGAWAGGKTVDFPIGNDDNTGWGGSMTRNGIKIQANGSNALFDNSHPTAIFECWQGEEYVTFTISMEDGSDILGVSMTLSGDYIGSFQNLEGWTGSEATRTWSGNAKSVNLRVNGSSEETINLEVTAISVTVPAAAEPGKYTVTMAEGTVDAANWTISPTEAAEGKPITATYSGSRHVKSVTAVVKAAEPATVDLDASTKAWADGSAFAVPAGGLTYGDAVTVSGNVTLTLTEGTTLTLNKGISLADGATLTVQGNGTMNVNGTNNSTASTVAGTGTLVLTSGTLNAKGGNGQGVGDMNYDTDVRANAGGNAINGNVTVSGGTLTATGGNGGGVGEMSAYSYGAAGGVAISGSVTVTGGAVTATGGNGGSIGAYGAEEHGGNGGAAIGGDATISGGTWTASDGTHGVNGDGQGGDGGKAVAGTVTDNRN